MTAIEKYVFVVSSVDFDYSFFASNQTINKASYNMFMQ